MYIVDGRIEEFEAQFATMILQLILIKNFLHIECC